MTELMTAAVTPEAAIADPPLCVPSAAGLLLALLLLSPGKPK
ncbi:hypothetical protein FHS29_000199 [Saccharothrix tamanrassetensis]|uniref:Uncharacterized protein n=1 Tax=Saccharothrix tamanrassetensis TaxID=1051531 RepID=A0A841C8A1_9PSEU|nr:hypothetical protein [Saccharothrix tamanrassetensis]MBB5953629.1 hypothetical protein [Saccharothrix tamanrassetensis]